MRAFSLLLPVTFCVLFSGQCPAQDDPLSLTLPSGRTVHFETAEQKAKFEAARSAQAARAASSAQTPTPKTADHLPAAAATSPANTTSAPAATPLPGTPLVNVSAPAFTGDYYGLPQSGAWVGRKVTLAVAYVRQNSADGEAQIKFSAHTYNSRPGAASEHMKGGLVTILATEPAARKLIVQCGTQFRYTAAGMTITMVHGVVQPLAGGKEYGVFVDY